MKHTETFLDIIGDELVKRAAEAEAAKARLSAATPPLLQLHALAEALAGEPEVQEAGGEKFTELFVPAVLRVVNRLRKERDDAAREVGRCVEIMGGHHAANGAPARG